MASKSKGLARTLAGLMTSMAAGIAGAQVATQPLTQQQHADPRYAAPPAAYAQQPAAAPRRAPPQPLPQQNVPQRYATQPAGYAQPAGYNQPGANGQPARPAAAAAGTNAPYGQPGGYQAPGAGSYPEVARATAGAVRPAQYEQPIEQTPAAAPAGVVPQPGVVQPLAAQPPAANDASGYRATEVSNPAAALPNTLPADVVSSQVPQEHPLMPALRWARQGLESFSKVQDYSCTLVKRERIDGVLGEHEYIFVKVRHHPFSVYTYFLAPARVKGQEAIFVDGQNNGSLLAHPNGIKHKLIGTVSLKPTSALAMTGNRYPITEMGIRRLLERLVEVASNDVKYGECSVNWIQGAKVNNRTCTCIQAEHPIPRRNFIFHLARIYVDDEAQLPIRYEAYDWPAPGTKEPQLVEEYTFLNVKLNNGFTDADFSAENAKYGFK